MINYNFIFYNSIFLHIWQYKYEKKRKNNRFVSFFLDLH